MALSPPDTFGQVARVATVSIDGRVLSFTVLVSLLSGMLLGLATAFQVSPELTSSLKEGEGGGLLQRNRVRQTLLVAEVALAVVLLIGAGLLLRSFVNLLHVEPGFHAENLLTLRISLPFPRYEDPARRAQFQKDLLEGIAAVPGVECVGAINALPLTDFNLSVGGVHVEGRPDDAEETRQPTPLGTVNPRYFRTLGIRFR